MPLAITVDTINRAYHSDDGMLEGAKKLPTATRVWAEILDFFSIEHEYYGHYQAKSTETADLFSQFAKTDLQTVTNDGVQYQIDDVKIGFKPTKVFGEDKVQLSVGDQVGFLEGVKTLEEAQRKVIADIKKNERGYQFSLINHRVRQFEKQHTASAVKKHERVDSGKLSTTEKVTYRNGDEGYFKPLQANSIGAAGQLSRIPSTNSRVAERSLLTYIISEILGFHIVPQTGRTSIAHVDQQNFSVSSTNGYVQRRAPGKSAEEYFEELHQKGQLDSLKSNSDLVRQLVEMQLLDSLTGQADRHMGNYFIDPVTHKVSCIDNDISWGEGIAHPHYAIPLFRTDGYSGRDKLTIQEQRLVGYLEKEGYRKALGYAKESDMTLAGRAVFLPPVMDTNMVKKFKKLNEAELNIWMSQSGFTANEKEAACLRLKAIHSHIEVLEKRQELGVLSIISPNDWGKPETIARLYPGEGNAGNALVTFTSYLQRDIALVRDLVSYEEPDWVKYRT